MTGDDLTLSANDFVSLCLAFGCRPIDITFPVKSAPVCAITTICGHFATSVKVPPNGLTCLRFIQMLSILFCLVEFETFNWKNSSTLLYIASALNASQRIRHEFVKYISLWNEEGGQAQPILVNLHVWIVLVYSQCL